MDEGFDTEVLYRQWVEVVERLTEATARGSGLPEALATYVIDRAGAILLDEVRALRHTYGTVADPPAEELWPLLELGD
ncbi:hypothetical protein MK786_07310 [Microbacterium sp. CFH 31415]|uniref:hypothetical protein n=1 Tax=Microbacterium sp. CFH 31415 TaxID=2921732 RepID=UPI001F1320B8|nr:hypothetical protein [Microbacterium sp. CFH 31415]MCH6230542.1 hypothetical protein [Microbacterium sp. CFH 31415]